MSKYRKKITFLSRVEEPTNVPMEKPINEILEAAAVGGNSEEEPQVEEVPEPKQAVAEPKPVVRTKKNTLPTDKVLLTMTRMLEMSGKKRKQKVEKEVDGKVKEILATFK